MATTHAQKVETKRPRSGSQNRQRQAVIAARLTSQELQLIRAAASQHGQSVSEYVRGVVLKAAG